ncbi:MAG: hypothetical protein IPN97_09765 [Saprospiraceae bacterium]|nr:hypothetical protein [Saprospiraceae bacterium]
MFTPPESRVYCWWVDKPGDGTGFINVSGPMADEKDYVTHENDFKVNGVNVAGEFKFKRWYQCSVNLRYDINSRCKF